MVIQSSSLDDRRLVTAIGQIFESKLCVNVEGRQVGADYDSGYCLKVDS